MNHLADFNISQLKHRQQSANSNTCNVTLNNCVKDAPPEPSPSYAEGAWQSPCRTDGRSPYPPGQAAFGTGMQARAYGLVEPTGPTEASIDPWDAFLDRIIAQTLSRILETNKRILLSNVIDLSGKIIVDIIDLVSVIGITCRVPAEQVTIKYERHEVSCCLGKFNPITNITDIKVNSLSYKLAYNEKYNLPEDVYGLSLKRICVGVSVLLP